MWGKPCTHCLLYLKKGPWPSLTLLPVFPATLTSPFHLWAFMTTWIFYFWGVFMQFSELKNTVCVEYCGLVTADCSGKLTHLCWHQLCPPWEVMRTRRKYSAFDKLFLLWVCCSLSFINQDVGPLLPRLGPVLCQWDSGICLQQWSSSASHQWETPRLWLALVDKCKLHSCWN